MTEKWRLFGVAGLAATAAYTANLNSVVNAVCLLAIGAGTVWACFTGPGRFGAEPRVAWRLMAFAASSFLLGVLVRPVVDDLAQPLPLLADAATVPGYIMLAAFLIILLRWRVSIDRHAVLDGLIFCLAGGLAATLLLAAPAAEIQERDEIQNMLAAFYPLFDVILLLLVVNLTFTARQWPPSLFTLLGTMTMLFVGDTAYAIIGTTGETYASPLLDAPFLVAYAMLGVTALHPSMVQLSRPARPPVQAWSIRRVAVLAPASITPFVLLVVIPEPTRAERLTIAVAGVLATALLLVRAVFAVRAQVVAQLRTEHQALHDALTGLPNRLMLSEEIERLLGRAAPGGLQRVWVFVLDLDGFKYVNESWGHDTGDQLVIELSRRLRSAAPAAVPVAALGGDEFALAYLGEREGALRLCDEVSRCFAEPFSIRGIDVTITASIGVASAPPVEYGRYAQVTEALMRDADTAMYRAKSEGPGHTTVFDASMHEEVRERIELEVALRRALEVGQLHVAYQPIVRTRTGVPVGAEALARWVHPERGAISPAVFIPIAEDAGLIGALGDWVRRQSLRQLGQWRRDGTVGDDFYLSINLSARQLTDPELPLIISAELLETGVPARCVALEMTESVLVDPDSTPGRVLFELRELGVQLLIDDFGTGFSSLSYLRRFPVTGVKLDRSFIIGLGQSTEDDEIVRAVAAMSYALGLTVIAEGVETRLQRDVLDAIGVTRCQGWLWGPAVPAAEFAAHWHVAGAASLHSSLDSPRTTGG
ncbi:putative bifunctional diguanylate cyclase/phosphodiesterase [Actinoplanes sp. NPDC048988]|uniref:putative bifunctional diguanylate cyclase/phosphodiesterase n=1 Tax=Actinoplanes sp. NPDC048988 TaxID=3363901 RepID=UPI0037217652